jgi:hypothetical protein
MISMTTFLSKSVFLVLVALALTAFGLVAYDTRASAASDTPAAGADTSVSKTYSTEKLDLAKKYVASVPVEEDIKAAVAQLASGVPAEQRVLFRSLADSIDYGRLRTAAELAAAEMFTDDEIKALTAFYSSPEGKSVRTKMPKYEERLQPVLTQILQDFVMKLKENNITLQGAM